MTNKKPVAENQPLIDELVAWGLSRVEAEIYVYLLQKMGESGGSKIALGAGLHRQYVYVALEKLISLGLVEAITFGKHKKYKARSPLEIEKITRKRSIAANDLAYELNKISAIHNDQDFEVLQGAKQIQQYEMNYAESAEPGDEEYIIGGNSKGFETVMGNLLDEYTDMKDRKQMQVLYVGGDSTETARYASQTSFTARLLPGFPSGQTHTVIRKDSVHFFSFLTPPLVYVIKSPIVAQDYKRFFMMLWQMAGGKS
jgi:sugar-specific transcriptional regulator TrmB